MPVSRSSGSHRSGSGPKMSHSSPARRSSSPSRSSSRPSMSSSRSSARPSVSRSSVSRPSASKPSISRSSVSKPSVSRPSVSRPSSTGGGLFRSSSSSVTKSVSRPSVSHAPKAAPSVGRQSVASTGSTISRPTSAPKKGLFGRASSSVPNVPTKSLGGASAHRAGTGSIASQVTDNRAPTTPTQVSPMRSSFQNATRTAATNYAANVARKPYTAQQHYTQPVKVNAIGSGLDLLYMAMPMAGTVSPATGCYYENPVLSKEYQESVLVARVATCFYMAYADNGIAESEKNEFDLMITDIVKNNRITHKTKSEVKNIAKTPITSFIQLEKYISNLEADDMISLIYLAEDMAEVDGGISAEESKAATKLRSYVSDITGYDLRSGTSTLDEEAYNQATLLAKLAVCTYVAKADDHLSDEDRNEVGLIINKILNNGNAPEALRNEVGAILNAEENSFVTVENYLSAIKDEDLAPFISLADEISYKDFDITIEERNACTMIREYVSRRTGEDYSMPVVEEGEMDCPNCSGKMEMVVGGIIECPYCGTRKNAKSVLPGNGADAE